MRKESRNQMDARFQRLHPDIYCKPYAKSFEYWTNCHTHLVEYWEKVDDMWVDKTEILRATLELQSLERLNAATEVGFNDTREYRY